MCIYAYTYIYIYIYICIHEYNWMQVYTSVYACSWLYVCACVYAYTCTCTDITVTYNTIVPQQTPIGPNSTFAFLHISPIRMNYLETRTTTFCTFIDTKSYPHANTHQHFFSKKISIQSFAHAYAPQRIDAFSRTIWLNLCESFLIVTWLIHMCDVTNLHV